MTIPSPARAEIATFIECQHLCHRFSWHLDHGDPAAWAALFCEEGTFVRDSGTVCGRAALAELAAKRSATTVTRHVNTDFVLDHVDGGRATGRSYGVVYRWAQPGEAPEVRVTEWHDEFTVVDGRWLFESRRAVLVGAA